MIFNIVSKNSIVTDKTISLIVWEISVVSVVSVKIILPVLSKISVFNHDCMLMRSPGKQGSQFSQYGFYFYEWVCKTA